MILSNSNYFNRREFKKPIEQNRLSEVKPFMTKPGYFDKNLSKLEEYRQT